MAGVVPQRATSGRKQWNLHDGPRTSLKRLRSQMATDGCPESQVVLAKQLLDEPCKLDSDTKENARVGVYWLIKASEQGNTEATKLLKNCLETGKGITELNYLDVKSCINMTQDEKLARRAAREMFASLSNGGEYITSEQLQKRILAIDKEINDKILNKVPPHNGELVYEESESEDDTDWSQKSDSSNEKLTEDHLLSAAVDYSHGHLPLVSRALVLSEPDLNSLDHIPMVQRSILHPILAVRILYYKLIRFLGRKFSPFAPIFKSEVQLVLLTLIYVLISSNNLLYFIPTCLYYISFVLMVISTFQLLQIKREFHDFRLWSGLFICYSGGDLNGQQPEFQYTYNNLAPYGLFFGALLLNLVVHPIISDQWIPQSEMMIISFSFTFMTLLGFMMKRRGKTVYDFMVFFSFGINVLAKYPYEVDPVVAQAWRYFDLKIPTFASYVIGNGIEFCLNFRLVLYLCIPMLLVKIASRDQWKGVYSSLLPHCVTLSWLQMFIISAEGATMLGLLRGSLALVGIVLFLPLLGLTSIILPAAALTKWIVTSSFLFSACTFAILSTIGVGLCWVCAHTRYRKIAAIVQVLCTFVAVYTFLKSVGFPHSQNLYEVQHKLPEFLSWEVYQRFCHQPVWQEENIAIAQIKCAQLERAHIHWDGYVNDVKIKTVSNAYRNIIDKFPNPIHRFLSCYYGEATRNDCNNFPDAVREECYSFYNALKSINECSLQKFNTYTFEITIRMLSGIWGKSPEVTLTVDHTLANFTLALKPNDHVWFKGSLFNNEAIGADGILGGSKTHVHLDEIGCLACANVKLSSAKRGEGPRLWSNIFNSLRVSFKFVLNNVLNPIVIFK